jgi:hypothetical protein
MIWAMAKLIVGWLGALAVVKWWAGVGATVPDNVNVILNFVSLVVLIGGALFAPRVFRAKTAEALLAERDKIISGHKQLLELREEETGAAREKLAELGAILDETRSTAASWEARYTEQARYTAGPALEMIQKLLTNNDLEAERRHRELLLALRAFASKRIVIEPGPDPGGP